MCKEFAAAVPHTFESPEFKPNQVQKFGRPSALKELKNVSVSSGRTGYQISSSLFLAADSF